MSKKYSFIILILLFSIGVTYFLTLKTVVKTEKVDEIQMINKIDILSERIKKLEEILSSKHENQQESNEKLVIKEDNLKDKILPAIDTNKSQKEKAEKDKLAKEKAEKKKAEKENPKKAEETEKAKKEKKKKEKKDKANED